jgi:hypothetical protein
MTRNLSAADMKGTPEGIDDPQHLHTSWQETWRPRS